MDLMFAIVKPIKAGWNMLRTLFRGAEVRDEKMMKLELEQGELVNDGTAIRLRIRVRNHGLTKLTVNHVKPRISIAGYGYHCNSIVCDTTLDSEDHNGKVIELIIPTPFLKNDFTINNINSQAQCDLFNTDNDVKACVDSLDVHITRGFSNNTFNLYLDGHTAWLFTLKGLHYFVKKAA
ncbi:hypothetical protein [uncultured Vibrio sp.]|uniref:hypothetical protein n=1 Tax=uncultured Vibrio sp. TaxID=114054 RepID=UPI00260B7BC8|nr:hypothetical protein [uncultured Vibrio sp.]